MITFIKDIFNTAFVSLWTKKLRTFLSILGIVIGILTVSALLTVALGVRKEITRSIGELGATFIAVIPGKVEGGNFGSQFGASTLTERDFALLQSGLTEVRNLSMASIITGNIKKGDKNISSGLILAGSPGTAENFSFKLKEGRAPNGNDENSRARVVTIGSSIKKELFGDSSAVGQTLSIRNQEFSIIGTLEEIPTGTNFGGPDLNSAVLMPLQTGWELVGTREIFRITMQAPSEAEVEEYKEKVKQIVLQSHGGEEDFSVFTQDDILGIINTILNLITALLSAIAAISLVVGGIGIMNTMLVAVSERTREIGIRKAVGATRGDILFQFVVESVMLTLVGGILAVIIFSLIILIVGPQIPIPLDFDWRVMGGAILFSVIVGVIFGVFPAYQASRKDPIDALRYE